MAIDLTSMNSAAGSSFMPALVTIILGMLVAVLVVGIIIWIYTALAFMAIGRKAKDSMPGLAWIPGVGPTIIAFRAAKMAWWPWLLLIAFVIPFVNFLAIIAFMIFAIIWQWKMFEAISRPGWWALMPIIPVVGGIIWLVMVGIAAWSKN